MSAVLLHWRVWLSEPAEVLIIGTVLSITVTVFVQVEVHPFSSVIVNDNINVSLQTEPAVTETVWELVLPSIDPFPEIFHK